MIKADVIAQMLEDGGAPGAADPLVITPQPNLDELRRSGSASVDLRLGTWLVSLRATRLPCLEVEGDPTGLQLTRQHYIPFDRQYYLHPRSFVLAATLEWIRLPADLGAYVVGRSSWGRRGLIIATATGVHPGFTGCLTLELTNVGEIPIAIAPGTAICQLFLHRVEGDAGNVDQSRYVARRKPEPGQIGRDPFAERLRAAYSVPQQP